MASAEGDTGKSAIALGLLALLIATSGRVGVFRPISRAAANGERDRILELMMEHLSADLDYDDCLGVTYDDVHADPMPRSPRSSPGSTPSRSVVTPWLSSARTTPVSAIRRSCRSMPVSRPISRRRWSWHCGRSTRLRPNCAHTPKCSSARSPPHASTAVLIANRCDPARLKEITAELATTGVQSWALPEDPILVAPTMGELQAALGAELYSGDPELLDREALRVMVGGMTVEHILERITDSTVVITPADRSDVLLALVNANVAHGFPRLTGIILNGGLRPHPMIDSLVKGMRATLPIIACEQGTYETARTSAHTRGQVSRFSARKIEAAIAMMEKHIDAAELMKPLDVPLTEVVTPQMFEYELLARARADRRHIVLPRATTTGSCGRRESWCAVTLLD